MNDNVEKALERLFAESDFTCSPEPTEPFGCICFTGWKYKPDGINLIAQILWWPPRSSYSMPYEDGGGAEEYHCVNLPNLSVGKYKIGDTVDTDTRNGDFGDITLYRLGLDAEENKLHREHRYELFREGIIRLVDFVLKDNPKWLSEAMNASIGSKRLYLSGVPKGAIAEVSLQDRVVAAADVILKEFRGNFDPSAVQGEVDNCYRLAKESGTKPVLFALQFLSRSSSMFQRLQQRASSGITASCQPSPNLEWEKGREK